jgi:hypothetical protein
VALKITATALGLCVAMSVLAACASTPRGTKASPAWFKESVKQSSTARYPRLEDVPAASALLRAADQWDGLELELATEHAELAKSPRSLPVPPGAQAADAQFEAEARAALSRPPSP